MNYSKISASIYNALDDNQRDFFNIIQEHFPDVIKDGNVDFDALKEAMGKIEQPEGEEKYELTWAGKHLAKKEYFKNILARTLKFKPQDSLNADTTENLYIEGDNLEVMKLLKRNYRGKIKMIYIDPPYNTGNDFIYNDNFKYNQKELAEASNNIDKEGNPLQKNSKDDSDYHSKWLNMMYPRLRLAKELLSQDGVIFISIDDNEQSDLKMLCDEVFGERNFAGTIPWRKRTAKSDVPFGISQDYEWVVVYSKSLDFRASVDGGSRKYYETPDFPNRPWRTHDMTCQRTASERPNSYFTMINPKTGQKFPCDPNRVWRVTKDTFQKYYDADEIVFPGDYDFLHISKPVARYFKDKDMLKDGENFGKIAVSTKLPDDIGMSQDGTKEIKEIFGGIPFSFPKTYKLIKHLTKIATNVDSIILDFFSGSATTAHAVMKLNSEDGGNRKFIMVQIPEKCDDKSEAKKAGFNNICEIGKERIRRAGKKIKEDLLAEIENKKNEIKDTEEKLEKEKVKLPLKEDNISKFEEKLIELNEIVSKKEEILSNLDIGFKCFATADTNIQWIYDEIHKESNDKSIHEYTSDNIKGQKDRIDFTPGFTDLDIVYELMLRQNGIPLSTKIEKLSDISDRTYIFADTCVVCLDNTVTDEIIAKLAEIEPVPAVYILRDSAFSDEIALKDYTYRKLNALINSHLTKEEQSSYSNFRVEFI